MSFCNSFSAAPLPVFILMILWSDFSCVIISLLRNRRSSGRPENGHLPGLVCLSPVYGNLRSGTMEAGLYNKFFKHKFVPAAQIRRLREGMGINYEEIRSGRRNGTGINTGIL